MNTVTAKDSAGIPRCFGEGSTITEAVAQCLIAGADYLRDRKDISALYLFNAATHEPIWENAPTQVIIRH